MGIEGYSLRDLVENWSLYGLQNEVANCQQAIQCWGYWHSLTGQQQANEWFAPREKRVLHPDVAALAASHDYETLLKIVEILKTALHYKPKYSSMTHNEREALWR